MLDALSSFQNSYWGALRQHGPVPRTHSSRYVITRKRHILSFWIQNPHQMHTADLFSSMRVLQFIREYRTSSEEMMYERNKNLLIFCEQPLLFLQHPERLSRWISVTADLQNNLYHRCGLKDGGRLINDRRTGSFWEREAVLTLVLPAWNNQSVTSAELSLCLNSEERVVDSV